MLAVPAELQLPRRVGGGPLKRLFVGRAIASDKAEHQLLPKFLALPVFSSDPLSSNAYATEEMMLVLALAGAVVGMFVAWRDDRLPPQVAGRLYPLGYAQEIAQVARLHGVDPYLVAAVVQTESGFDPESESAAGAVGLMQLMPRTARQYSLDDRRHQNAAASETKFASSTDVAILRGAPMGCRCASSCR